MGRRGRPKGSGTSRTKKDRPELFTKEDLLDYLTIADDELPFHEQCWEVAVEKAKQDEGKEVEYQTVTIQNPDGSITTRKKRMSGMISTNPVSWYWKMRNLPCYNDKPIVVESIPIEHNNDEEEEYIYEDLPTFKSRGSWTEPEEYNDIIAWINMFKEKDERKFLQQKYDNYYDTYEINDGADKALLSLILSLEIDIYRMNKLTALGEFIDIKNKEKVAKTLRETLEAMKWTKRQRDAKDEMAQNRFTVMMDKQCENGSFKTDETKYDKDEIDFLLENIPIYTEKMDWRQG